MVLEECLVKESVSSVRDGVYFPAYVRALKIIDIEFLVHLGVADKLLVKNYLLGVMGGNIKKEVDDTFIKNSLVGCLKTYGFTFMDLNSI